MLPPSPHPDMCEDPVLKNINLQNTSIPLTKKINSRGNLTVFIVIFSFLLFLLNFS